VAQTMPKCRWPTQGPNLAARSDCP
jgi:hypothetical protein